MGTVRNRKTPLLDQGPIDCEGQSASLSGNGHEGVGKKDANQPTTLDWERRGMPWNRGTKFRRSSYERNCSASSHARNLTRLIGIGVSCSMWSMKRSTDK